MLFLVLPLLALGLAAAPGDPAREAFESAVRALAANDLSGAERGFQQVLKTRPDHIGALGNLGVVYSRMGRFHDAIGVYRRALKAAPGDFQLNLNLGLAYLKQDDYRSARPALERAAAARPEHPQTRELLATARLFTGEVGPATEMLEGLRPSGSPSVLYLLSIAYLKAGRRDEAQRAIADLFASVAPAQAHFLAGRAYYESTLFEDAGRELRKARELDPALPGVARELGKVMVSLRRADEARAALEEAIQRNPGDIEARYFLGALMVQADDASGVAHLEKSKAARPDFWGNYYYLGRAALSAGRHSDAVRLLTRASELQADDPMILYQLARALKAGGRTEESAKVTRRLAELRRATRREEQESLVVR